MAGALSLEGLDSAGEFRSPDPLSAIDSTPPETSGPTRRTRLALHKSLERLVFLGPAKASYVFVLLLRFEQKNGVSCSYR